MRSFLLYIIVCMVGGAALCGAASHAAEASTALQMPDSLPCPLVRLEVERLPDLNIPRAGHNIFYANGELTVVGGHTAGFVMTPTAEYLSNGEWHLVPTVYHHDNGMAVVLHDGKKVLIAGGHEKNLGIGQSFEVESYNQTFHSFNGFGCLDRKRAFASGVEMNGGHVLIAGNHTGNDAFELYDGQKFFTHVKDVAVWRSSPYLLRTAPDNAIAFGPVWRNNRFEPCDTVERLNGEPFTVPLLRTWMPMLYDQNNHAANSRIGDYSYIVAASNADGKAAFIRVTGADFSLLPTVCSIPTKMPWGNIVYSRPAIADTLARHVYLMGNDSTGRAYIISAAYDKTPAPLTLYYTDPLPRLGDATPVLTPDGDLIVAGGINGDNFAPFDSVWLLHLRSPVAASPGSAASSRHWLIMAGTILAAVCLAGGLLLMRNRRRNPPVAEKDLDQQTEEGEQPAATADEDSELMQKIRLLMEAKRLYLNPNLKVTDVADTLGIHRNSISACINTQEGCTFAQYVNRYRMEHVKQTLLEQPDRKINAVATESGFANETSFFRTFKSATGMTPREWVTAYAQKRQND